VTSSSSDFKLPFNPFDPLSLIKPPAIKEPVALSEGYEVEGSWVLKPVGRRTGVVHLMGGAFVGASPQVSYALLMEELANLGFIVIATPYDLTFDHCKCAEAIADRLDRALGQLCIHPQSDEPAPEGFQTLPLFVVGHSNGALLNLLAASLPSTNSSTAYSKVKRAVLMSYNNKPVSEAVPGGVPDVARTFAGQLLELQSTLQPSASRLQALIPREAQDIAKNVLPLIEQLDPTVNELAEGAQEFTPTPEESRQIIVDGYRIPSTLLIQFANDSFDQTPEMANLLATSALVKEVEVEEVKGIGHITPLGGYVDWTVEKEFTPLDAVGQAIKGEAVQRVRGVASRIEKWLLA